MDPLAYFGLLMLVYAFILYWPTHFLLGRLFAKRT